MESSSGSADQQDDEPLDLSTAATEEFTDAQAHFVQMVQQATLVYGKAFFAQNLFSMMVQSVLESSASALVQLPALLDKQPEESPEKENLATPRKKSKSLCGERQENESTPSPSDVRRRTSTGKIDRRMVGKNCTRRVEANARERNRVQQLSKKFDELRDILPVEEDAKISKLATLKVATSYIAFLGSLLKEDNDDEQDDLRLTLQLELESAKSLRK